jgi:serine carboxypeptidase-like clade 1
MRVIVALLACVVACYAAIDADLIQALPGWNQPLPSKQYSGYLNISGGKHLHYWLVQSENKPATDPLVFWFNGGPGCSSLDGYLYELGPFHVVEPYQATNNTLYYNPSTWAKVANMVFLEAPACVGLSYADTSAGCVNNDKQQAQDNFEALQQFYKGYPEYSANDLFITGESYAGMYVPTLALQVLAYNNQSSTPIPLKGIAVGNGVIGSGTGENTEQIKVDYLHGHGLFSDALYADIVTQCGNYTQPYSTPCKNDLTQMSTQVGNVNIYDIYADCVNSGATEERVWRRPPTEFDLMLERLGGPVECLDGGAAQAWLDQADVRQAIHVPPVSQIGEWELCTNKLQYTSNWGSLLPNYKNDLIPAIRVLIFNGDADACVPYNGNEWWTSTLGVPQTVGWTAWNVNNQVAGYVTKYQMGFEFVTVKGAGHMVPEYKPVEALEMFSRYLKNTCC